MAIKKFEQLGKGITGMPFAPNYEATNEMDVTDQVQSEVTAGAETMEATPVTFRAEDQFSILIDKIVTKRLQGDDVVKRFLVVQDYKRVGTNFKTGMPYCWIQEAAVQPGEFGIDTGSLKMSATLNWTGKREYGKVDFSKPELNERFVPFEDDEPSDDELHFNPDAVTRGQFKVFYIVEDGVV